MCKKRLQKEKKHDIINKKFTNLIHKKNLEKDIAPKQEIVFQAERCDKSVIDAKETQKI
ncbi:MAG: hypothetical protein FWE22_06100 [Firmicutes bacterium]|nr:hypothetical protein [Bacillota bacterium]